MDGVKVVCVIVEESVGFKQLCKDDFFTRLKRGGSWSAVVVKHYGGLDIVHACG